MLLRFSIREALAATRRRGLPSAVALILAALTVAPVAACMGSGASMPAPAASSPAAIALPPIDAALYGQADAFRVINGARQRLIAACMSRQGFVYPVTDIRSTGDSDRPHPFGLENLAPGPRNAAAPSEEPRPAGSPAGDERYNLALFGSDDDRLAAKGDSLVVQQPAHGCVAEADTRLLGDARQRWTEVRIRLSEAEARAGDALQGDAAYRALNDQWRACVNRAGLTFNDPIQLLESLPPGLDLRADPRARADIGCKQQTDYLVTAYARMAALQTVELNKNATLMTDWNRLLRQQLTIARAVPAS
jgi:hypothetical protein